MIKALVVEDKPYVRKAFLSLLNLLNFDITITEECENVKEAIISANTSKPDLIFLDINLPDGNAFDFLDKTNHLDYKVIFITAHEEYALRALKTGAIDYLLKPIDLDDLEIALNKVIETPIKIQQERIENIKPLFNSTPKKIVLSLLNSLQIINLEELMFCKSDKGYTSFYLENGKVYMASKPLKDFEEKLNQASFTRPHQSYMVNLNFIDKYDKSGVIFLKNKQRIPVSSRKKDLFVAKLLNWHS